jgi:hypothetical protein
MGNHHRSALLVVVLGGMLAGCLLDAGATGTPCHSDADCPVYFSCSTTCQPLELADLPPADGGTLPAAVSFATQVQPIFQAHCGAGCHAGGVASSGVDLSRAETSFATLVGKPSVCDPQVPMVEPGEPANSMLWRKLSNAPALCGGPMPTVGALKDSNPEAFELIEAWISQGALDN